jgi:hypothetical protein
MAKAFNHLASYFIIHNQMARLGGKKGLRPISKSSELHQSLLEIHIVMIEIIFVPCYHAPMPSNSSPQDVVPTSSSYCKSITDMASIVEGVSFRS